MPKRFITYAAPLDDWQEGQTFPLPDDVQHHAQNVMRLQSGDALEICHPNGILVSGCLDTAGCFRCTSKHILTQAVRRFQITLALSLIKWPRFEWAVEKITELGIQRLIPLQCQHSVIRISDWSTKAGRIEKIAAQAARQSLNPTPPEILPPQTLESFCHHCDTALFFAQPGTHLSLHDALSPLPRQTKIAFIAGPEGGFSHRETDLLQSCASPISLGPNILRTETAAISLASILAFYG